jgi:hypothetical protein
LLGKDLETNNGKKAVAMQRPRNENETTAVAMQQRSNHAFMTTELLLETVLCNPLLGSCNSWTTTMETGIFSMLSVPWSYLEDN